MKWFYWQLGITGKWSPVVANDAPSRSVEGNKPKTTEPKKVTGKLTLDQYSEIYPLD